MSKATGISLSFEVSISLIGATTTTTGLQTYARLDERDYPTRIEISDAELAAAQLTGDEFHPEWNYTIAPKPAHANSPP